MPEETATGASINAIIQQIDNFPLDAEVEEHLVKWGLFDLLDTMIGAGETGAVLRVSESLLKFGNRLTGEEKRNHADIIWHLLSIIEELVCQGYLQEGIRLADMYVAHSGLPENCIGAFVDGKLPENAIVEWAKAQVAEAPKEHQTSLMNNFLHYMAAEGMDSGALVRFAIDCVRKSKEPVKAARVGLKGLCAEFEDIGVGEVGEYNTECLKLVQGDDRPLLAKGFMEFFCECLPKTEIGAESLAEGIEFIRNYHNLATRTERQQAHSMAVHFAEIAVQYRDTLPIDTIATLTEWCDLTAAEAQKQRTQGLVKILGEEGIPMPRQVLTAELAALAAKMRAGVQSLI